MIFRIILIIILFLILIFVCFFFVGFPKPKKDIKWGVVFSQKHAQKLGLDWKENYSALLDDLKVKRIKVATYWDLLEPEKDNFAFEDLDWQIKEAEKKGAKLLLVIGMKTPRWPECHIPGWAEELNEEEQKKEVLNLIKEIVLRYKKEDIIWAWQIENEPFFKFGKCPWEINEKFLKKEINLVKSLDPKRSIIISDAGELSFWFKAARYGDILGITMYREVWVSELGFYFKHIFPPAFYRRRAQLIKKILGKEVICIELQAEPWGPTLLYDSSLEEQMKSMDLEQFRKNVEFAKKTNLKEFYLWGAEWWYWMKEKQNKSEIWEEAKKLFRDSN